MNKILYILLLTLIIANNPPVWTDIPAQTIEEDCSDCTGFPIDLNLYVSDIDGDDIEVIASEVDGAIFNIDENLFLNVFPNDNFNTEGSNPIVLELIASDAEFDVSTTFDITITAVNDIPEWTQAIDNQTIEEDCGPCTGFPIDLNLYISDPDQDPLNITVSDVTGATFSVDENLLLDIEVDLDFNTDDSGPIEVELILSDGEFDVPTAFEIIITSVNDNPFFTTIGDGHIILNEDDTYEQQWTSTISPGPYESEFVYFNLTFDPNNLVASDFLNYDGFMSITLESNISDTIQFTVLMNDQWGGSFQSGPYYLAVSALNDEPIWTNIPNQTIEEDCDNDSCDIFPINLESFISDVEDVNEDLTISVPDDIDGGTFSIDGFLLDATLDQDFNGTIEFNVTATDLENASSDALFSLEVTPVNDAPEILSSNTPVYNEDCCIENGILLDINDFSTYDADGDNLTLYINEFLIPEDSDYSYDANELLIYPNNNFFNELSIPVYVSDSILDSDVFYYPIIINSINDFPVWGEVPMQSVLEDCANNSCDIFPVNLESFISDVEDENEDLIITIPDDITGGTFTITDFLLDATLVQDFNGTIEFDITATDLENASSDALFSLEITPVNDPPTFSPIDGDGNIEMYEDSIYIEKWLANISPGNAYENDIMTFQLEFDDPDFVEEDLLFTELSAIDSIIKITPKLNANGGISFSVQLSDDGGNENGGNDMSEPQHYILTINPVNDAPEIFAMVDNPLIINEDSEDFDSDYFSAHPGGGDGRFKETNDSFIFEIINDYDTDLFNRLPNIESNNFNTNIGVLSFSLEDNYNGNTDFLVRVTDDGASSASSGPPFNNALSFDTILNVQINQINDMPIEFNIIDSLYAYQVDSSTFIGDSTFRFPYQPFYTSNQLSNKMRFKWQNKPDLDVDLDPNINKDYTMDSLYYYLQMYSEFETINLDTITYQNPSSLDTVIVDIDLTSEKYNIDLTGNTPYYFRVLANNHQLDIFHDDPTGTSNNPCFDEAQESSCSFFIDLTLPTLDMNYLHDDLFIEHFDLYMKASENFVDFDDFDRPLKLWIYYNSVEAQPEILFPDLKDTLNNIYFSSYNFKYSGDINFIYQMRDQAANINQDSLNVSFSIIDPSYPSTISFDDNTVELNFPSSSVNNLTPCLISKTDINFNNGLDMIGYPIKIYPVNIELNDSAVLSFDLDIIPNNYDLNHCGLYYYDNYNWILSDTYIENNKIKSRINNFGSYAIFYNEHEETLSFPDQYILMQNHPNPFNPETMINFYLPEDNYIEINIYNIKGEKVKTIYQGELSSGYQSIKWNGVNDKDISLPSGIYIVSLSYNNQVINNKTVKLK